MNKTGPRLDGVTASIRYHLRPGHRTTLVRWRMVGDAWHSDTYTGIYNRTEERDGVTYYVMAGSWSWLGFDVSEWAPCEE